MFEMISSGMKKQFVLTNPEYGIKGYNLPDPLLKDNNHKIKGLTMQSQKRFKNGFVYNMIKTHSNTPACLDIPLVKPWTEEKYLQHSGDYNKTRFLKEKKVTMTEQVMKQAIIDHVPPAHYETKT